jgi:hypothetical protein
MARFGVFIKCMSARRQQPSAAKTAKHFDFTKHAKTGSPFMTTPYYNPYAGTSAYYNSCVPTAAMCGNPYAPAGSYAPTSTCYSGNDDSDYLPPGYRSYHNPHIGSTGADYGGYMPTGVDYSGHSLYGPTGSEYNPYRPTAAGWNRALVPFMYAPDGGDAVSNAYDHALSNSAKAAGIMGAATLGYETYQQMWGGQKPEGPPQGRGSRGAG